jgi:hypothetical protein
VQIADIVQRWRVLAVGPVWACRATPPISASVRLRRVRRQAARASAGDDRPGYARRRALLAVLHRRADTGRRRDLDPSRSSPLSTI